MRDVRAAPSPYIFGLPFEKLSMAEQISLLDEEDRDEVLDGLTDEDIASYKFWARPDQKDAIEAEEWVVVVLAGRGYGKTFTGAEWVIEKARSMPGTRIALVGRTVADVRDVMIKGESGILALSPDDFMPDYTPSVRKLVWPNGSIATTFSATEPDQLRGPQHHYAWVDELGAFKDKPDASGLTTWDQVLISTRLGSKPQIIATTTPKRTNTLRELLRRAGDEPERIKVITGSTMDNRANLASDYIQTMLDLYKDTALERQELFGEMLGIVEGALWRESDFYTIPFDPEAGLGMLTGLQTVISVDPSASATGDATGIVVVTGTLENDVVDRNAWVREDLTVQDEPEVWAKVVADAWLKYHPKERGELPPVVLAEQNQGGAMVRAVIQAQNPNIPVVMIPALTSKADRARPVVMAYRQGRVKHDEWHDEIVEECTVWEPPVPGSPSSGSKWSPNRMDALVHGIRVLLVDPRPLNSVGSITMSRPSGEGLRTAVPEHRRGRAGVGLKIAPWRERMRR